MEAQTLSVVECGWCDQPNRAGESTHCKFCSGPLPAPAGQKLAEKPSTAPRVLPEGYLKKRLKEDKTILMGKIFVFGFFWAIIFPIIGYFIWKNAEKKIKLQVKALQDGDAVEGQIADVYRDTTITVNGRNPWALVYAFETNSGQLLEGTISSWDRSLTMRSPGDKTWVVYVPLQPEVNSIWPPIKK